MSRNPLICVGDGDNIGDVIDFCLLSENLEEAGKFSFRVKTTLEDIATLAEKEMNASLVYVAGDDICFVVSASLNILQYLNHYSNLFFEKTGKKMSFGVGETSTEALISLRKAKVSGKGCVVFFGENNE